MTQLIKAMRKILDKPKKSEPICHQVPFGKYIPRLWDEYHEWEMSPLGDEFQALVKRHISKWHKANQDGAHWIPSSHEKLTADMQYQYCREIKNYWRGQQGDLRREALAFLIDCAEQELQMKEAA